MASGGCLCGDVTYEYDQEKSTAALHCHCRDCQKVTGSGKATIVLFQRMRSALPAHLSSMAP